MNQTRITIAVLGARKDVSSEAIADARVFLL